MVVRIVRVQPEKSQYEISARFGGFVEVKCGMWNGGIGEAAPVWDGLKLVLGAYLFNE